MMFDGTSILDREKAKLRAKPITDLATPMLKEVVDVGCAIYDRCLQVTQRAFLHKPALALYRHVLETTDAIQVLIESSCVASVVPLLRSGLEGAMSLEYMFLGKITVFVHRYGTITVCARTYGSIVERTRTQRNCL